MFAKARQHEALSAHRKGPFAANGRPQTSSQAEHSPHRSSWSVSVTQMEPHFPAKSRLQTPEALASCLR